MKSSNATGLILTLLLASMLPFAFTIHLSEAYGSPPPEWTQTYGGAYDDAANSIVETSDGGFALAGSTNSYGLGDDDFWLVKVDLSGNLQWNRTYGGTDQDVANSIVETSDGGFALAGVTRNFLQPSSGELWMVRVDSSGNLLWNLTYGGIYNDAAYSIVETKNGGFALAGYIGSFPSNRDFWLVKVDGKGTVLWNMTYGEAGNDDAYSIVETSDGGFALAGSTNSYGLGDDDFWLVKVDLSGNLQWNRTYGGAYNDVANSIVETSDGGFALAGSTNSYGAENTDFWLVKVDANGTALWNMTYGGPNVDAAYSIVEAPDGGFALAGFTWSYGAGNNDVWLVRVDLAGNLLWNMTYGGANNDVGRSVVNSLDGGFALSGITTSYGAGSSDGWLIKIAGADRPPTRYPWSMFHHNLRHTGYSRSPAPNTNQTLWNYTTSGAVYSSPTVAYGKVYVGSTDNKTYCLNATTGVQIWNYATGSEVRSSPAVTYERVYVGSGWPYNKLYCLNATTGAQIWNYATGAIGLSSPAVAYGKVYVGSEDFKVYCLDAATGVLIWNYTTGASVTSSPAVADGKVYVGSMNSKVYCLNALTGVHIWNYTTGGGVWSSPAVADGKVYVGSLDSKVYCLNATTGGYIWNYATGGGVWSSPAVADGKVYVGSMNSKVYCLNATTGVQIWNYATGGWVESSPAVADGTVFIGAGYNVYAFGNIIRVPEDYPTIQQAINVATSGATISIALGTYNETIIINKTVALLGKIGSSPVFDGGGSGIAVTITPEGSGSVVAGIEITNFAKGISINDASDCQIYDTIMSSMSESGVFVQGGSASGNVIYGNIFQDNAVAISLDTSSTSNTIHDNAVSLNTVGLDLSESTGNIIYANTFSQNDVGINLSGSDGNTFYWNNFVDNTEQITVAVASSNTWDNNYPGGGNYWSDYAGTDVDGDGIGDTPYVINVANKDWFPLMEPWPTEITLSVLSGDVNGDGIVDSTDLGFLGLAWPPGAYNSACDFNKDMSIDSTDLGVLGINWGQSI